MRDKKSPLHEGNGLCDAIHNSLLSMHMSTTGNKVNNRYKLKKCSECCTQEIDRYHVSLVLLLLTMKMSQSCCNAQTMMLAHCPKLPYMYSATLDTCTLAGERV